MQEPLQLQLKNLLSGTGRTVSAAESCTGGNISHMITTVSGSSEYYLGSVTSYAVEVKNKVLGVPFDTVEKSGIVSSDVAVAMAEGVRNLTGSTYSVATTGWAGESGDEHEPAGTVWVAVAGPSGTISGKFQTKATRVTTIRRFTTFALRKLVDFISKDLQDCESNNITNSL